MVFDNVSRSVCRLSILNELAPSYRMTSCMECLTLRPSCSLRTLCAFHQVIPATSSSAAIEQPREIIDTGMISGALLLRSG